MAKSTRPASGWEPTLALDPSAATPRFLQIARAIVEAVRDGRLSPGTRLPGTRPLAMRLAVHRNTVIAAYEELASEGWIESTPASGTFVSAELPERHPTRFGAGSRQRVPRRLGLRLPRDSVPAVEPPSPAATINLSTGSPDLRLVPRAALAGAYRRALLRGGRDALDYRGPEGHPRLRRALATMLAATRGLAVEADDLLVTRGSQMVFDLLGRALLREGELVAVEEYGYAPAWAALRRSGAELVGLPVDRDGLDVAALAALCRKRRLRALYLTPHHQYPTTATLAAGRRLALLELAARYRFAIFEDDYDHEFHFAARPVLPLASADRAGVVVYIGTLAKLVAPGLRLGYVVAPRPLLERLRRHRVLVDHQGDATVELAMAELFEEGELLRHSRRVRRIYAGRRAHLAALLAQHFGTRLEAPLPPGGLALWARAATDVARWACRARADGLLLATARDYRLDGRPRPFVRLGFASLDEEELRAAVARLARAWP